jgi:putative SOS response-associated peptidase YedK
MCGRYTNTAGPEELNDRFQVPITGAEGTRRYNVAPTEEVLAIVNAREGGREAILLRWGLVPPWAKDLKGGGRMINARMESITTTPAYRALIPKAARRALQLADGYFEWLKPEQSGSRAKLGPRQPFYFQVDGGVPFAFAAVWTPAKIDGGWVRSVSLLTCDASSNRTAAAIHDRMPVILADEEQQRLWLDPALGAAEALELCGALPTERLSAHPANPALNSPGAAPEGPELLQPPA